MYPLILGSSSPRRKDILGAFSLPFSIAKPLFDEEEVHFAGDPIDYVYTLAKGKAETLVPQYPESIILTADTVVYCNGIVYNKPRDYAHAQEMLMELVGRRHTVYTGVAVRGPNMAYLAHEETAVYFNPLTLEQVRHYLAHMRWDDKSGSYSIEAAGGLLVKKIEGSYSNVLGLPVNLTQELLLKAGIDLWKYVR